MNALLNELKRRKVLQVASAYLVTGWLTLQVAEIMVPALQLPEWVLSLVLLLAGLGFPVALLCAWAVELTAQGVRLEEEHTHAVSGRGLASMTLVTALIAAVVGYQAHAFAFQRGDDTHPGAAPAGPVAVAVLPFVSLSTRPEDALFSDRVTEELLDALSVAGRVQVVARTSTYALRESKQDLRIVGQRLAADFLIEGTVRRWGDRLRVTAHLISSESGYRLSSGSVEIEPGESLQRQLERCQSLLDGLAGWI